MHLLRKSDNKKGASWDKNLTDLYQLNPSPSVDFSQTLIDLLQRDVTADMAKKGKTYPYRLRSLLDDLGYYLHPDSYTDASKIVRQLQQKQLDDQRGSLLENWLELLSFRQSMTQLFTDS